MWQRRDLKKVQRIRLAKDGAVAFCGIERRPCLGIDIWTGEQVSSFRGSAQRIESLFSEVAVVDRGIPEVIGPDGLRRFRIERTTFAMLSCAIGPDTLSLSESGGPVRCFELASGKELWRHTPPRGTHFLKLAYSGERECYLGISWPYQRGGPKELVWFSPNSGEPEERLDLGRPAEMAFSPDGSTLILSTGAVYSTSRGTVTQWIPVDT